MVWVKVALDLEAIWHAEPKLFCTIVVSKGGSGHSFPRLMTIYASVLKHIKFLWKPRNTVFPNCTSLSLSTLDSFRKRNRKNHRQWFWNGNLKNQNIFKHSNSKTGLTHFTCSILTLNLYHDLLIKFFYGLQYTKFKHISWIMSSLKLCR